MSPSVTFEKFLKNVVESTDDNFLSYLFGYFSVFDGEYHIDASHFFKGFETFGMWHKYASYQVSKRYHDDVLIRDVNGNDLKVEEPSQVLLNDFMENLSCITCKEVTLPEKTWLEYLTGFENILDSNFNFNAINAVVKCLYKKSFFKKRGLVNSDVLSHVHLTSDMLKNALTKFVKLNPVLTPEAKQYKTFLEDSLLESEKELSHIISKLQKDLNVPHLLWRLSLMLTGDFSDKYPVLKFLHENVNVFTDENFTVEAFKTSNVYSLLLEKNLILEDVLSVRLQALTFFDKFNSFTDDDLVLVSFDAKHDNYRLFKEHSFNILEVSKVTVFLLQLHQVVENKMLFLMPAAYYEFLKTSYGFFIGFPFKASEVPDGSVNNVASLFDVDSSGIFSEFYNAVEIGLTV